ncbi:MAG: hypothetical protein JWM57_763 [Phycisphaerales bacterium]|nr:hypothetical protein [Phycisphaerales bacterium]
MQTFGIRSAVLLGGLFVGIASSITQATVLYDSGGFETSAGFVTGPGGAGAFLAGQTGGTPASTWIQSFAGAGNAPLAAIYPYAGGISPNFQRVQVQDNTVPAANGGFFNPNLASTPYTPGLNQGIAITWTMRLNSGLNNPFYGIVAYSGADEVAQFGVNGSSGALVGSSGATFAGFTAAVNAFVDYELLLNYTTKTYSVYTSPNGAGTYTLRGGGLFVTPTATAFTDADIASFSLAGTDPFSGSADFDFYKVETVTIPEPATISVLTAAFGLLTVRRRKSV